MHSRSLRKALAALVVLLLCLSASTTATAAPVPNLKGHYFGTFSESPTRSGSVDIDVEKQKNRNVSGHINIQDSAELTFSGKIATTGTISLKAKGGVIGTLQLTLSPDGTTLAGSYQFHAKHSTHIRTGTLTVSR